MKKLLSILLALVMVFALTAPALAAAPEADLDPPLWRILGFDSYEETLDDSDYWTEETYAAELSGILSFMETRPDETARFRANAYNYYEEVYAGDYGSAQEYMTAWNETEEQFITDMTVWQIWDLQEAEEYAARWAALCAEKPEKTAQFLAELDGWFAQNWPWYDSFDEYAEEWGGKEAAYLWLFDEWSYDPVQDWADLCAEQPEKTAQFLAELDGWFAQNWTWYDSFDEYAEDWGSKEAAYLRLFATWKAQDQARQDFIAAHGGTPGQFNLMINGKFLTFPAERPLYQTGGVTYVDAQTLSEALGVEVAADEKGYAAVRPAAEAAGFRFFWDKEYNAGVFISPEAVGAGIDKNFTVYNRLLARNVSTAAIQRSVGNFSGNLTLFDTINGNRTADLSCAYDVTASRAGVAGTVDYDLSALWAVLEKYIAMPLDGEAGAEDYARALELVRALTKGKAEVRVDLEQQMAWCSMPVLFRALNSQLAQSGVQLVENSWISLPLEGLELYMDALPALPETAPTVGSLLCAVLETGTGNGSVRLYDSIMDSADQMSALFGDGKFTRKGDADVLTFTREDLLAMAADDEYLNYQLQSLSQFDLTLSVKDNGDAELDFACRLALESGGLSLGDFAVITARAALKGAETETTMEYHLKNILKLTATSRETRSTPDTAPDLTPPKGAAVFDLQKISDLLEKMDIPA